MNKEMHQKRELTAAELDGVAGGKGKIDHNSPLAQLGQAVIQEVRMAEVGALAHHIM